MNKVTKSHEMSQLPEELQQALSDKQSLAVVMLSSGKSVTDVASELGVARETVSRWRSEDAFAVALNWTRQQMWDDSLDALRALVADAVTVLQGEMRRSPGADVALKILKAVGVHGSVGKPRGPVSLRELERARQSDKLTEMLQDVAAGL